MIICSNCFEQTNIVIFNGVSLCQHCFMKYRESNYATNIDAISNWIISEGDKVI